MKFLAVVLTMGLFSISHFALADQCDWNKASDAQSAVKLINMHKEIMFFCQNCGDSKPSFIAKVVNVRTKEENKNFRSVNVKTKNGPMEIDLAYTYVRTASDIFANIAHLVGCPSEGAVTFIQTTNTNQKIQHFYDAQGVRQNTATTTADIKNFDEPRKPASKK